MEADNMEENNTGNGTSPENFPIDEDEVSVAPIDEPHTKQSLFDLLYGIIAKPVNTFRYLTAEKPWVKGALIYVLISWITTLAGLPAQLESFEQLDALSNVSNVNLRAAAIIALVLIFPIVSAAGLFIMGGIYHLLAKLLKGQGEFKGIIASLGFANFPSILITPFYLLYFIGGSVAKAIALIITLSISFAFGIWVLVLDVLAIRENYKLSTARAVAVCLIPIATAIILAIFLLILLIVLIAASIPQT
jgi:hypothetical protein